MPHVCKTNRLHSHQLGFQGLLCRRTCQDDMECNHCKRKCFNISTHAVTPKRYIFLLKSGPSVSTGEHCICIVSDLLWLGLVWSCFVFCLLFLLFYVICAPVLTEGTLKSLPTEGTVQYKLCIWTTRESRYLDLLEMTIQGILYSTVENQIA